MRKMQKQNKRLEEHSQQSLWQDQVHHLTEIGLYLSRIRQEKGLSIEQLATKTRISHRYLRAIEDGQLDQLPESVYIKGFIKRFADAMGCNGSAIAADFPSGPALQAIKPSWRDLPAAQLRPLHLYVLYIAVILFSIAGLSFLLQRPAQQTGQRSVTPQSTTAPVRDRAPDNEQNTATEPEDAKDSDDESPSSDGETALDLNLQATASVGLVSESASAPMPTTTAISSTDKPIQVEITVNDPAWLQVVADGEVAYEGTLAEGTRRQWQASNQLVIRSGNAGGVLVTSSLKGDGRNWKDEPMGDPGTIEEVVFKAENPRL